MVNADVDGVMVDDVLSPFSSPHLPYGRDQPYGAS
jgi:hypothetical protein